MPVADLCVVSGLYLCSTGRVLDPLVLQWIGTAGNPERRPIDDGNAMVVASCEQPSLAAVSSLKDNSWTMVDPDQLQANGMFGCTA